MGSDELTLFLSITLTGIAVPGILMLILLNADSAANENNVLRYSKGFDIIGIGGFVLFSALTVWCLIQDPTLSLKLLILLCFGVVPMLSMAVWLILISCNFKIVFNKDSFVYTNLFRITKTISYSEITRVVRYHYPDCKSSYKCMIYLKHIRIETNMFMSNYNYFADEILKIRLKQAKNPVVIEKKIKGEKNKP